MTHVLRHLGALDISSDVHITSWLLSAEMVLITHYLTTISASRKKFAQIAKVFSRRKRTSSRTLLPSVGRDQLLISADPLIEDEDDERQTQY
ncbi:hypothetical protein E2C01_055907 [Portunus trituberculatus]|uniref:Uncharacterized protein n=1 Tax=Portunus trituberculatus TaxID=210409 RepID=A0A5B7GNQ5_PORTR|nr:hypothetical protein [Portunus trituberculatus]